MKSDVTTKAISAFSLNAIEGWTRQKCLLFVIGIVWPVWFCYMYLWDGWALFSSIGFMSITMAIGSFIAGATAEGGGAIAFPAMTLIFNISPSVARDFSLIIQAVGMNAAALTIIATRTRVIWPAILFSGLGGSIGVTLGLMVFSGLLPPGLTKLFFVSFWVGFGFALWSAHHFFRNKEKLFSIQRLSYFNGFLLFAIGIIGGITSGITGSGLDIVTFSVLTLYFRICPTVATPTSVVLMGNNALIGALVKTGFMGGLSSQSFDYWLVSVPIVVIGAPLGAIFMKARGQGFIVNMLISIIVIQFVGALCIIPQTLTSLIFCFSTILLSICAYVFLIRYARTDL